MDPDQALKDAREAAAAIRAAEFTTAEEWEEAASALEESFDALDGWIKRGGFLPADWKR